MRPTLLRLAAATVAAALASPAPPAGAIVRRHDRADAAYRALADRAHPVAIVGGLAHGTLVAPRWVLTAAHVADGVSPFVPTVRLGALVVPYDAVRFHPARFDEHGAGVDLALLHLARPVTTVMPAALSAGADTAGQAVLFLGTGMSGDGQAGPDVRDHAWRGARNRITETTPRVVRFVFDAPPGGEDLEGISGPGDSGGPAFVERGGRLELAGVSSSNGQPGGQAPCTYGTVETYARVSTQRAWIDAVMQGKDRSPGADWTPARALASGGWPAGPVAATARAWFAARNANEPARLEAFLQQHADSTYLARRTPAARRAAYADLWRAFGAYTPVAWSQRRDGTLAVLVRAANDGLWLDYRFAPSPDAPGRLRRIESMDLNAPGEAFTWPPR